MPVLCVENPKDDICESSLETKCFTNKCDFQATRGSRIDCLVRPTILRHLRMRHLRTAVVGRPEAGGEPPQGVKTWGPDAGRAIPGGGPERGKDDWEESGLELEKRMWSRCGERWRIALE